MITDITGAILETTLKYLNELSDEALQHISKLIKMIDDGNLTTEEQQEAYDKIMGYIILDIHDKDNENINE